MPARWGLGPVFAFEWLIASRRWQMYAVRALVVLVLLGALVFVWEVKAREQSGANVALPNPTDDYSDIGEAFFSAVIGTQLSLILFVAPAATAGAVCVEKTRGTLLHLLVTDLSATEIVLGKLASRLIPVLGLIACSVPVLMIGALLGGLDVFAVAGAYAVLIGAGVLCSALALLLSVWGRRPAEVLLAVYVFEALWLFGHVICSTVDSVLFRSRVTPTWLADWNPYLLAFAPYHHPGLVGASEYRQFLTVTWGAAAVCTVLAIASVRPVARRYGAVVELRKVQAPHVRQRQTLALDRNLLLWYERRHRRPSRWTRFVWSAYIVVAIGGAALALYEWLTVGRFQLLEAPTVLNSLLPAVGLLLATVAAVTAMAEERVRGSLDVLLSTPLLTRAIVWAKWRTAFRPIPRLLLLPAFLGGLAAWSGTGLSLVQSWACLGLLIGLLLASGAFLTSLGLALATWIPRVGRAIGYYVGLYVFQCVVWPLVGLGMFGGPEVGAALLSPVFAGETLTGIMTNPFLLLDQAAPLFLWGAIWVVVLTVGAGLLYWLTVVTFDRCLGRMPERGRWRDGKSSMPFRRDPSPRGERWSRAREM
jgi:ABC-type transport system involved in multi-copper enzyme maturation permease subunit